MFVDVPPERTGAVLHAERFFGDGHSRSVFKANASGSRSYPGTALALIPDESRAFINDQIQENGKISMIQIANRFNVPEDNALELMYEVLKEFEIHGTFDIRKKFYYSVSFLNTYIIKTVEEKGRVSIKSKVKRLERLWIF